MDGISIERYREVRDALRRLVAAGGDVDAELLLRDALDSIWFRLKWSERQLLGAEFEEFKRASKSRKSRAG